MSSRLTPALIESSVPTPIQLSLRDMLICSKLPALKCRAKFSRSLTRPLWASALTLLLVCPVAAGQKSLVSITDSEVAARFAPIFYQALGDKPRSDFITNFDFDGDWKGDNNWDHAEQFPLKAFVYYSVAETASHYFIHYAVFHPRDYKGGERKGTILSELIREGVKRGGRYDPTGLADEAVLAHENDLEGCLVVVRKNDNNLANARVEFVETLHHNNFSRYLPNEAPAGFHPVTVEDQRALLYIEPKGHGIEAFTAQPKQISKKLFVRYVYTGEAQAQSDQPPTCREPEIGTCSEKVGYALLPIETLWLKADDKANETFAEICDYRSLSISLNLNGTQPKLKSSKLGKRGCAFAGKVGGQNMARPPWGWFDKDDRNQPLGQWFFDPAVTVKRDYGLPSSFSTTYVRAPFWMK